MPLSFNSAYREALASANSDQTTIDTITIDHTTFSSPFRFARLDEEGTFNLGGDNYIAKKFDFSLPQVEASTNSSISISIEGVGFEYTSLIDGAMETTDPITVLFKSFIVGVGGASAYFDQTLEVSNISISNRVLSINAGYPDIINRKVSRIIYDTIRYPGIKW